jgi:hypothetical protein
MPLIKTYDSLSLGCHQWNLILATVRVLSDHRVVHLTPVERGSFGKFDAEPNLVALDLDHREDDVIAEDYALVLCACDDDDG